MSYTAEQYAAAIARAQAAGDSEAVADLQERAKGTGTPGGTRPATTAPEGAKGFQRASGRGPMLAGASDALLKTIFGVSGLFGGNSPETKAVLREMEAEKEADPEKGWRTGGEMGGNLLATAIPGGAAAKAIQGAKWLPRAIAPIAAAAGSGAATELATAPGQGDSWGEQMASKGEQALKAGAAGGMIGGGLQAGRRFATGLFPASAEAKSLLAQGVTPTLQQGADGAVGRFIGGMSGGAMAQSVAKRQNNEVIASGLERIAPGRWQKDMTTSDQVRSLEDFIDNGYTSILGGKTYSMTPTERTAIWKATMRAAGREPDAIAAATGALGDAGQALRSSNPVKLSYQNMVDQRNMLQDQINVLGKDTAVKSQKAKAGMIAAKDKFDELVRNKSLSPEELTALKAHDAKNFDAKRFLEAAQSPTAQSQMKVADLLRAYKKLDPKGGKGFARAEAPVQDELLEPASRTLHLAGQDDTRASLIALRRAVAPYAAGATYGAAGTLGGLPIAAPLALGYATSLLGQTKSGAKALMGETEAQKKLAELLRKRGVDAGTIGGIAGTVRTDEEEY